MVLKLDFKKYLSVFLLVYVLFMSNNSFDFYYLGLWLLLLLFFIFKNVNFNKSIFLSLILFGSIFLLRSLLFFGSYNLKECLKFFTAFAIFSLIKLDINWLIKVLLYYVFVDFVIGVSQFFHVSFWVIEQINSFYGAETFYNLLSVDSVRSYGLSSSAGNRAALLFLILVIFSNFHFKLNGLKFLTLLLILISIFLAQSKTVLLVLVLYLVYKMFLFSKLFSVSIFSILLVFVFYFNLLDYLNYFTEYSDLILNGINTSSLDGRFVNWNYYITGVNSNILTFMFGPGRDFFSLKGDLAPAFDSDYLYLQVNFGLIGILFVVSALILGYKKIFSHNVLSEVLFFGLLIGLSLNFFFDIKILFLLMILFSANSNLKYFFK